MATLWAWPVVESRNVICVPGTTAPLGSVTVPMRVPVLKDWASTKVARPVSKTAARANLFMDLASFRLGQRYHATAAAANARTIDTGAARVEVSDVNAAGRIPPDARTLCWSDPAHWCWRAARSQIVGSLRIETFEGSRFLEIWQGNCLMGIQSISCYEMRQRCYGVDNRSHRSCPAE